MQIADSVIVLQKMDPNMLIALSRDRVPTRMAERLLELGLVYDYYGDQTKYRVTIRGAELVAEALKGRGLVGKDARPARLTDEERMKRKVDKIRHGDVLEARRLARLRMQGIERETGVLIREEDYMDVRSIEQTDCVTCGSEIDYKMLRIFDRRKKYECVICGHKVRPKRVPGRNQLDNWHGRLPTILIGDSGFAAVVCWDCLEYCQYCWTDNTYKYIMRVYGVDLRDA